MSLDRSTRRCRLPRTIILRMTLLTALCIGTPALADPCPEALNDEAVSGIEQCLRQRQFGSETPTTLLIWLHGDVSSGGPANYHFAIAEKASAELGAETVKSVALVRPGYPDGRGAESTVALGHGGRRDHYTAENLREIVGAVERLKAHYAPKRTLLVGHSGGAASAAVILGMAPQLADGAVLVACPCELATWRSGRGGAWPRSENPINWVDKVAPTTRIIALTGERDSNTGPALAQHYTHLLQQRGIAAEARIIPYADHNAAFRAPEVTTALRELLATPTTP